MTAEERAPRVHFYIYKVFRYPYLSVSVVCETQQSYLILSFDSWFFPCVNPPSPTLSRGPGPTVVLALARRSCRNQHGPTPVIKRRWCADGRGRRWRAPELSGRRPRPDAARPDAAWSDAARHRRGSDGHGVGVTYEGCPGDVTGFYLRCQGELLGRLWDPQNRDLRRKLPPETKF